MSDGHGFPVPGKAVLENADQETCARVGSIDVEKRHFRMKWRNENAQHTGQLSFVGRRWFR
jgi:hypothetical protein